VTGIRRSVSEMTQKEGLTIRDTYLLLPSERTPLFTGTAAEVADGTGATLRAELGVPVPGSRWSAPQPA
jgi:hypothetical protein